MSGTLVENRLSKCWGIMDVLFATDGQVVDRRS